jgi:hypothetical protein
MFFYNLIQIILQENQFGIWFYVTRYLALMFSYLICKEICLFIEFNNRELLQFIS